MGGLEVERFAEVLAHVAHFGDPHRDEVLRRLGCSEQAFFAAARRVPGQLADSPSKDDGATLERFSRAFEDTKKRLAKEQPELATIGRVVASEADAADRTLDPASPSQRGAALPFAAEPPRAPRVVLGPSAPAAQSGATMAMSAFEAQPSTPFEEHALAEWDLDRYAAFVADRRRGDALTVRQAYGVTDERMEHTLLVHFNKRFAKDPALRERWLLLLSARLNRGG